MEELRKRLADAKALMDRERAEHSRYERQLGTARAILGRLNNHTRLSKDDFERLRQEDFEYKGTATAKVAATQFLTQTIQDLDELVRMYAKNYNLYRGRYTELRDQFEELDRPRREEDLPRVSVDPVPRTDPSARYIFLYIGCSSSHTF